MKKIATFLVAVLAMVGLAACDKKTTTKKTNATTAASTTVATTAKATTKAATVAPTTKAATTVASTTKAATVAPTTKAPTTVAPTTKAATVAPTTKAPTTVAPTTKAPTTVAPTTVAPTTKAPTTVAPTTTAPKVFPAGYVNGDVVYSNNFDSYTAGTAVENFWDGSAANVNGICFGNSGAAASADNTAKYDGTALVINDQDMATGGKEGQLAIALPSNYSLGKVTIYMEVKITADVNSKIPGGWSPIQIYGTNSAGETGKAILGIRTNNKPSGTPTSPYAFNYEGATSDTGVETATFKNSSIPYYHAGFDELTFTFTMDFENNVASCVINNETLTIINFNSEAVNFVKFITKSSNNLEMRIDNFAVGFEAPDFATYQPKIITALETYFNANKANYTTNIDAYTAAYNDGKTAMTAATTSLGAKTAYDEAVVNMEAILDDVEQAASDLAAHIVSKTAEFETAYAAYDVDNKYTVNKAYMKAIYDFALDATQDENYTITSSTDIDSVDAAYDYYIEELGNIKSDLQLDQEAALAFDVRIAALPDPDTLVDLSTQPAFDSLMAEIDADLDVKALLSTTSTEKISATETKYVAIYEALPADQKLAIEKTNGKAAIEIEYAKYDLSLYETNGAELTSIVTLAKTAIDEALDSATIDAIIEQAKNDMDSVLTDEEQVQADFEKLPTMQVSTLVPSKKTLTVSATDACPQGEWAGVHDIFTFVGTKWQVDGNAKSIDGVDYTHRMKSGGTGSITFKVLNDNASLYIAAMSGSSGTVRTAALDKGGVAVGEAYSNDGTAIGSKTWTGLTAGDYTISLTAGVNFYNLTLNDHIGSMTNVKVESISVTTNPTKMEFNVGDTIDLTGMVVTASYKETIESTAKQVALTNYVTNASTIDMTTAGEKEIEITYSTEGSSVLKCSIKINVIPIV